MWEGHKRNLQTRILKATLTTKNTPLLHSVPLGKTDNHSVFTLLLLQLDFPQNDRPFKAAKRYYGSDQYSTGITDSIHTFREFYILQVNSEVNHAYNSHHTATSKSRFT